MATFSTAQVNQFYVAKALKATKVTGSDAAGTIRPVADASKGHLYFEHAGPGGLTRSDLIDIKNIASVKAVDADKLARPLKRVLVTLDSGVNSGDPIGGQDYILKIAFRNYIGISDEYQYTKIAAIRPVTGLSEAAFYTDLALNLVRNLDKEASDLLNIYLKTSSAETLVKLMSQAEFEDMYDSNDYEGIIIEEKEQEWTLGTFKQNPLVFDVLPGTITEDGEEVVWGTVTTPAPTSKVENGKAIADLEYFCMGERGDIYREVGFPYNMTTKYLVDPTVKYNIISIHYAFQGMGDAIQKSEKDITIAVPKVGATNAVSNALTNNIIDAIETATGLTIAGLATT